MAWRINSQQKNPNRIFLYFIRKMEIQLHTRTNLFYKFANSVASLIHNQTFALFHAKYYIKEFKIEEIDETMAKTIYSGVVARSNKSFASKNELNWLENQLRMFVWTLLYYAQSKNIEIHSFSERQWDFFRVLFPNKRTILFQYQAYNLLRSHNQYKKWSPEEDELFGQLVQKDDYRLRWSDLGKSLFIESEHRFFRTPKQCRERWLNHLDPSKMKKCWTKEEDFMLIQFVKYFGKKWANISKKLNNRRNQHSIKNRFKSLITKESKFFVSQASQKQIVNSLFSKLLEIKQKTLLNQQQSINIHHNHQHSSRQHENFIFSDEDRPQVSIFDECDHSLSHFISQYTSNNILANPQLNHIEKDAYHGLTRTQDQIEKAAFQFSKIQPPNQFSQKQNNSKCQSDWSQIEKRVRADLFLQQDPFQMLKGYFYKNNCSSE